MLSILAIPLHEGLTCTNLKDAYTNNACCDKPTGLISDATSLPLLHPVPPMTLSKQVAEWNYPLQQDTNRFGQSYGKYVIQSNDAGARYRQNTQGKNPGILILNTETGEKMETLYDNAYLDTELGFPWGTWAYNPIIAHGYVWGKVSGSEGGVQKAILWKVSWEEVLHAAIHSELIQPEIIYRHNHSDPTHATFLYGKCFACYRTSTMSPFGSGQIMLGDHIYYHDGSYWMNAFKADDSMFPNGHVMHASILNGGSGVTKGTYTFPNPRGGQALEIEVLEEDIVDGVFTTLRQKTGLFPVTRQSPTGGEWAAYKNSGSNFQDGDVVTATGSSGIQLTINMVETGEGTPFARMGINPARADYQQVEILPNMPRGTPGFLLASEFNGGLVYWGWRSDVFMTRRDAYLVYMPDPSNPSMYHDFHLGDIFFNNLGQQHPRISLDLVLTKSNTQVFNVTSGQMLEQDMAPLLLSQLQGLDRVYKPGDARVHRDCYPTMFPSTNHLRCLSSNGMYTEIDLNSPLYPETASRRLDDLSLSLTWRSPASALSVMSAHQTAL